MITTPSSFRLALVSMPWALLNRPSIQLAILKAFLEEKGTCQVDLFHPYLRTGKLLTSQLYEELAVNGWAGEALFSGLLFPKQAEKSRKLFHSLSRSFTQSPDFSEISSILDQQFTDWLETFDPHHYDLLGFSVCFYQLLPSLYLARKIKQQHPRLPIVFGGSSCTGEVGQSLIHTFKEIDYIVDGEGELPLLALTRFLSGEADSLPDRIFSRHTPATQAASCPSITALDTLPTPDFGPYFSELQSTFAGGTFIPQLPVEFSRGCWWNRCTFCNLNQQWRGYRQKSHEHMVEELLQLSQKYGCLDFCFTDNALPEKASEQLFSSLAKTDLDLDFFAEVRATDNADRLHTFRSGGLSTVQVGIEALSSSLLKKMEKGTTVMDNIQMMKLCAENHIKMEGNLILYFPSSTSEEVEETLLNLDYVLPYPPLQGARFFLGHGSPVHRNPQHFGIRSLQVHRTFAQLLPKTFLDSLCLPVHGYRGDRIKQRSLWKPVQKKIKQWHSFHKSRSTSLKPPLLMRNGKDYLLIRQELISSPPLNHRLKGLSKQIYLFCNRARSKASILQKFPTIKPTTLDNFVSDMCDKRLMFQEDNQVLSLAIHDNTHRENR